MEIKKPATQSAKKLLEILQQVTEDQELEHKARVMNCAMRREELQKNPSVLMQFFKFTSYLTEHADILSGKDIGKSLAVVQAMFVMAEENGFIKINDKFTGEDD